MTAAPTRTGLLEQVLAAVRQIRPEHPDPQPGDTFTALGLDSLDRLALAVAVEQATGLAVGDQLLADAAGPADLTDRLLAATDRRLPVDQQHTSPQRAPGPGWLDPGSVAGAGTRLWHQAQIATGAVLGADCTLGKGCFVGAGSRIGDRVKIGNYANLFGAVVGDEAMICPGVLLLEDPAPRATNPDGTRKGPDDWTRRPVTIGPGATIGAGATVAPGVSVGAHALVALGAVVLRDVPAHGLVIGNPARQVGWVCRCGQSLDPQFTCPACQRSHQHEGTALTEIHPPSRQ